MGFVACFSRLEERGLGLIFGLVRDWDTGFETTRAVDISYWFWVLHALWIRNDPFLDGGFGES